MRAWLFQDSRQKEKLGGKCPWSVAWYDAAGKKRSKKVGTKSVAEKFRQQTMGQLSLGLVTTQKRVKWTGFKEKYKSAGLTGLAEGTVREYMNSLDAFERIIKPVYMDTINTAAIDGFIAARRKEPGRLRIPKAQAAGAERKQKRRREPKATPTTSPATVDKDLRQLKAAFAKAVDWGQKTTQIYINAAHRLSQAKIADKVHAPDFLARDAG